MQKKTFIMLLLWMMALLSYSQSISKYEYWFDQNESAKVQRTASGNNVNLSLDVSNLSVGLHAFVFRAQDSQGRWSAPSTNYFVRAAITSPNNRISKYEYWFDQNHNSKVQQSNSTGVINLELDVKNLSKGLHMFCYRAQDTNGRWSAPLTSFFLVAETSAANNKMTKYEYWFDQNHNRKVQLSTSTGVINLDLEVADLSVGLHSLCYRAQDSNGRWSTVGTHYFVKPKKEFTDDNKIVSYQYWFNEADNHAVTVTLDSPVTPLMLDVNLDVNNVNRTVTPENVTIVRDADGNNKFATQNALHMHFLDQNGRWSMVATDSFAVVVEDPDLTGFIKNPNASLNRSGWTFTGSSSIATTDHYNSGEDNYFHLLGNPSTMTQTVSGLPAGTYMLSMMGRSLNGATLEVSINGIEVTFNENEWTSKNLIFTTDGNPFEIRITKTGNGSADIDDLLLTLNNAAAMTVKLAESANIADYQGMTLELGSDDWTVQQTINSGNACVFNGLSTSKEYSLTLKNQYGMLIASQNNIQLHTGVNTIVLDNLAPVHTVSVKVLANGSQDVTGETSVTWYDAEGAKLSDGTTLVGIPEGTTLAYDVKLSASLATQYQQPTRKNHTVTATGNELTVELGAIAMVNLTGQVVNENYEPIVGATVTITQWVNGSKQESKSVATNNNGTFETSAYNDSTEIVVSAEGYINQTLTKGNLNAGYYLGMIVLKKVTGTIISLNITYQETVTEGNEPVVMDWYTDTHDIKYSVYNATKGQDVTDFTVQNNEIIIPVALNHGDRVVVTANSLNGQFAETRAETQIGVNDSASVTLRLMEHGGMDITYQSKNDDNLIAFVYDTDGKMVSRVTFSGSRQKFTGLSAGAYRLVTMGYNGMVGAITDLADLDEMGLENGIDYVTKQVTVRNGYLTAVNIDAVPEMDPSKFSFTSANTSYLSNKSRLVAGKFITMTARVDFSSQYANRVSNVSLIVDIPDDCSFVDNSVVIGSRQMAYVLNGNKLTIPLADEDLDSRIRFCVVPTRSGVYTTSAFAKFDFRGEKMQPIGSAVFEATDIAVFAPSSTRKTLIPVSGVTTPEAKVDVYDNGVLIGSTKALKDGNWSVDCELNSPYNLSTHRIYAEIHGTNGITLTTGSKDCLYDINSVEVKSVLMTFYNAYSHRNINVTFDFETGKTSSNSYSFYTATNFTFVADLTANDTTSVRGVTFYVYTNQDEVRQLQGFFDKKLNRWVAVSRFESSNLPVNLAVDVESYAKIVADRQELDDIYSAFSACVNEYREEKKLIDTIITDDISIEEMDLLLAAQGFSTDDISGLYSLDQIEKMSDEEIDQLLSEYESIDLESELLLSEELINSIDAILTNEKYGEFTTEDGGYYCAKHCDGLNDEILTNRGFEKIETTDGQYVYLLASENQTEMVDFSQDLYVIIKKGQADSKQNALLVQKAGMSSSITSVEEGIESFNKFVDDVNNAFNTIKDAYDDFAEAFNWQLESKILSQLRNAIKSAENRVNQITDIFHLKLTQIARLEKRLKTLDPKTKEYEALQAKIGKEKDFLRHLNKSLKSARRAKLLAKNALKAVKPLSNFLSKANPSLKYWSIVYDGLNIIKDYRSLYVSIPNPCPNDETHAISCKKMCISYAGVTATTLAGRLAVEWGMDLAVGTQLLGSIATGGSSAISAALTILGKMAIGAVLDWAAGKADDLTQRRIKEEINNLKCYHEPEPRPGGGGGNGGNGGNGGSGGNSGSGSSGNGDGRPTPPFHPVSPIHDPSGYVYEAVTSNRLEGVTATIYSKSEDPKRWNAAEYSQVNPIVTDETGLYAWDVPQGQWQVRFEKEGYETAQTAWLPVPPPQLEINIPMLQGISPEVIKAHGVQSGITLTFSKYMRPETVTQKRVSAIRDEKSVSGNLNMVNLEEDPYTEKEYASKIKFEPNTAFNVGDVVFITVKKEVESYAGTPMANDVTLRVVIEPEVSGINVDSLIVIEYGSTSTVDVTVLPADAVKGKTLTIESGSPLIASIDKTEAVLDENGRARITLKGELPGGTSLHLTLAGTDMETTSEINVVISETVVRTPKASVRSGSSVFNGDQLVLTSATPGAVIYYTLDGSCPCDEATRIKYTQPIVITENVTIKAMAVKDGMTDSDIVTLIYVMDDGTGINSVHQKTYDVKWSNGSILVTGAQNATCSVYNTLGHLIAKRKLSTGEEGIKVSGRGIFLVAIELPDNTSYVYKIVGK